MESVKPEILLAVVLDPDQIAHLETAFTVRLAPSEALRAAAIVAHGESIRAFLTDGMAGCRRDEIDALPNLRIVCSMGAGFEAIDVAAARSRGIPVTTGSGANAAAVAEHALALLFSLTRRIPGYDRDVRSGAWVEQMQADRALPLLFGKRLGILGLGQIGARLASIVSGLEMTVAYHNRRERGDVDYRYFPSLQELARWCNFLVVSCVGGPETQHLVNEKILEALGPEGYLVNVSRGSVVDTAALVEALRNHSIAGAALDVVDGEPSIPDELLRSEKVILTPHVGWRSPETKKALIERAIGNIRARLAGEPLISEL